MQQQRPSGKQDAPRQQFWQEHVTELENSDLSRREYCRQNDLSYHALTYWCRKVTREKKIERTSLVPVTITPVSSTDFVPTGNGPLTLVVQQKYSIQVADDFSPVTLGRLVKTLEAL